MVSLLHLSAGHWTLWAGGAEDSWNSVAVARVTLPPVLSFGFSRWWLELWGEVSARAAGGGTSVSPSQVESRLPLGLRFTVPLLHDLADSECSRSLSPLACLSEATQPVG